MASMLRYAKSFITLKNVVFKPNYYCSIKPSNFSCSTTSIRCMAVQHGIKDPDQHQRLESALDRLDYDARRMGQIAPYYVDQLMNKLPQYRNVVTPLNIQVLLRCCGDLILQEAPHLRTKRAHTIWNASEAMGLSMDLSHYNALLRIYLENEHEFCPLNFLAKIEEKGIEPNRVTYQRLLQRFCQMGDIERAIKILEVMKDKKMLISSSVFQSIMLGHSRANDLESAVEVLELMKNSGHQVSDDTYGSLAVVQAEHGAVEGVRATMALARDNDMSLTNDHIMEVVYALAVKGHHQHLAQFVDLLTDDRSYNIKCKKLIYRLMNAGQLDVGRQLYNSMEPNTDVNSNAYLSSGLFFVRHLVRCDASLATIMSASDELCKNNPYRVEKILQEAVHHNTDLALSLMDIITQEGRPIRPHYFWPIINRVAERNDPQVCEELYALVKQIKLRTDGFMPMDGLVSILLPAFLDNNLQSSREVLNGFVDEGFSLNVIFNGLVQYYIRKNDSKEAIKGLLSTYKLWLDPPVIGFLVKMVQQTGNYTDGAIILSQIRPDNNQEDNMKRVDKYVMELAEHRPVHVLPLLQSVHARGLSMSTAGGYQLLSELGDEAATDDVKALVTELTSGTLQLVQLHNSNHSLGRSTPRDVLHLESDLAASAAKGKATGRMTFDLLREYCRRGDVSKAEELFKTIDNESNEDYTRSHQIVMMMMYCNAKDLQKTMDMVDTVLAGNPGITIDSVKLLEIVRLLIANARTQEAIDLLENQAVKDVVDGEKNNYNHWNQQAAIDIVNDMCEAGNVQEALRLVSVLLNNKFVTLTNSIFSPIIKFHLDNNNLEAACEAFVSICEEHRVLPLHSKLLTELIKKEDTDWLQKVLDITTNIMGEGNALLSLAVAFICEGKFQQAKKIMLTPGLRINPNRIEKVLQYYFNDDNFKVMEDIVQLTASIYGYNRLPVFTFLLAAYEKINDCDKALDLWTQMQDENVTPSDKFLSQLGNFLVRQNKPVPFVIPGYNVDSDPIKVPEKMPVKNTLKPVKEITVEMKFKELLDADELDQAMVLYNDKWNYNTTSMFNALLNKLMACGKNTEAVAELKRKMSNTNGSNLNHGTAARSMLASLREAGDVDTLMDLVEHNAINKYFSDNFMLVLLCKAAENSGRTDYVFDKIQLWIEDSSAPYHTMATKSFEYLLPLLRSNDSLLPKVEKLDEDCKAMGLENMTATLWSYHLFKNNVEKCNQLKTEMIGTKSQIHHSSICAQMRREKDTTVAPVMLELAVTSPELFHEKVLVTTYNTWIDILTMENKPKESLQVLETALKQVDVSLLRTDVLRRLQTKLELENIAFPYTTKSVTARRNRRKSSSSSSSDSD